MKIQDLVNQKRWDKVYVLARYFYRVGMPIMDDDKYDRLEMALKQSSVGWLKDYFERAYDDDPVPIELLREIGVEPESVSSEWSEERRSLFESLEEDKSNSIRAVRTPEEVWEWFQIVKQQGLDFVASLKVDGVNMKGLWKDGKFELSMSRGRHGNSFDYTGASRLFVPEALEVPGIVKVVGECYVEEEVLASLREKYNTTRFKTPKSAAISMLRVMHQREDYEKLHYRVFFADGVAETMSKTLETMERAGFETVPYIKFKSSEVPDTFEEFSEWLNQTMDRIAEMGQGIKSDGMTLEIDRYSWAGEQRGAYNSRQIAVKFGHWGFKWYEGTVTGIEIEQRRVYKSVKVRIEPMYTDDGCEAMCINSFNPSILIENDLWIGKKVYFEKNSGAVNILIHGKRLEGILEEKNTDVNV